MQIHRISFWILLAMVIAPVSFPDLAHAQNTATASKEKDEAIIVTAKRIRGEVVTDVPAIETYEADDIASFGASSIQDFLNAIEPQTGSVRGRGTGRPIVLINGQPVSGFRALRNIPPEAIRKVQVLPEEVALQFGYRPDQRVINFILKELFSSLSVEAEHGLSTDGGYGKSEFKAAYTKFTKKNDRINLSAEYEPTSSLTEAERGILQPVSAASVQIAGPIDAAVLGEFRTLIPQSAKLALNANYSTGLGKGLRLSLNAAYENTKSRSFFGLNAANLTLPALHPFNQGAADTNLLRYFVEPRPLMRRNVADSYQAGFDLNGTLSGWKWSLVGDVDYNESVNHTDQRADFSSLQTRLLDVNAVTALNPFENRIDFQFVNVTHDLSARQTLASNVRYQMSGRLLELPAGEVRATLRARHKYILFKSQTERGGVSRSGRLVRGRTVFGGNVDIPLFSRDFGVGAVIGDVSINANAARNNLTDFGSLNEYGFGLVWKPIDGLSLQVTSINEESAPSTSQLGNPILRTPNVAIFDFARGETSFVDVVTGGNNTLRKERRRDLKLSLSYRPPNVERLRFEIDYVRNRSFDKSESFPSLTPEIEAAFAARVIRDGNGQLVSVDRRAVSYDRVESDRIRYGFSFSKRIGQRPSRRGRPQQAQAASSPTPKENKRSQSRKRESLNGNKTVARPKAGRRRGGPRRGRPGRWSVGAYHTIRLKEAITIRPGIPTLDLLRGSATGANGGASRHKVSVNGGWFNNGLGVRVSANYKSGSKVLGGSTPGSTDLIFGDITTLNLRFFVNLGRKPSLVSKVPFLKGSRLALRVNNITNSIQNVRDQLGNVPLRYQPGFVDPRGRFVELSFRKVF